MIAIAIARLWGYVRVNLTLVTERVAEIIVERWRGRTDVVQADRIPIGGRILAQIERLISLMMVVVHHGGWK